MASEQAKILRWFYRNSFPEGVLSFDRYLIDAAQQSLSKSRIDAEAYAVSNSRRLWNHLAASIQRDAARGIHPIMRTISAEARRFIWHPFDYSTVSSRAERIQRSLLQARPDILRSIDTLSNRQYEALGCVVSKLIGADKVSLTRCSNEGGVDFFALINVHSASHFLSGVNSRIRIVGQCKKYTESVQVDKVKEFVTTLNDVKCNRETVKGHIPNWFHTFRGPIVGWVVAHSGFQAGAEARASSEGMIFSDSVDLAQMAALSRALNREISPTLRVAQLKNEVEGVLREFSN